MILLIALALGIFVVPHASVWLMHRIGFWPAVAIVSVIGIAAPLVLA
jgi:hypothetical protein